MGYLQKGKQLVRRCFLDPASGAFWRFYGKRFRNPELVSRPSSLIFICKGNICRSPFAERYARKVLAEMGHEGILLDSGGLEVTRSVPPPEHALVAARRFGVNLEDHMATRRIQFDADHDHEMVVVMETSHFQHLRKEFPNNIRNIFLLPMFNEDGWKGLQYYQRYNISDPYGRGLEEFIRCYERIAESIGVLLEKISIINRCKRQ